MRGRAAAAETIRGFALAEILPISPSTAYAVRARRLQVMATADAQRDLLKGGPIAVGVGGKYST